jgi:hypothetical protein
MPVPDLRSQISISTPHFVPCSPLGGNAGEIARVEPAFQKSGNWASGKSHMQYIDAADVLR